MCLCCCQHVQVYLVHISCCQVCALVTFPALLNHMLCLHHHLYLLLAVVTSCTGESLEEVVLKGSHQILQTGGKQMLNNKGTFDPGLEKKRFKSKPSLDFCLTSGSVNLNIDEI